MATLMRKQALLRSAAMPFRTPRGRSLWPVVPVVLVFYSFLLFPPEASVSLSGLQFPAYRVALLALALPAGLVMARSGPVWPNAVDFAVVLLALWILLSFSMVYGIKEGLVRGGGRNIDTALPYLIARASIRDPNDLRYFLLMILPGLVFNGLFLMIESLTQTLFLRPAFGAIFGVATAYSGGDAAGDLVLVNETRLGLRRAYAVFSHPILAGVTMAAFLPLFAFSGLRSWPRVAGVAACLTAFFSLSSAVFLALIIGMGAVLVNSLKPLVPKLSWWAISGSLLMLTGLLHIVSQNGIISVIARLTLTPATAHYRTLIWEYGLRSIGQHPWFGLGYKQWERLGWMGESVDAHFLALGIQHGVIAPILLLFAVICSVLRMAFLIKYMNFYNANFAVGMNVAMIMLLIIGQTVTFFGSSYVLFMSILGFHVSMICFMARQPRR